MVGSIKLPVVPGCTRVGSVGDVSQPLSEQPDQQRECQAGGGADRQDPVRRNGRPPPARPPACAASHRINVEAATNTGQRTT